MCAHSFLKKNNIQLSIQRDINVCQNSTEEFSLSAKSGAKAECLGSCQRVHPRCVLGRYQIYIRTSNPNESLLLFVRLPLNAELLSLPAAIALELVIETCQCCGLSLKIRRK